MTSRERVMLSFENREPDRVPCWCGASPEFIVKAQNYLGTDEEGFRRRLGDDFRRVYAKYAGPDLGLSPGCSWKSPFGIERKGIGYGQPTEHPLKHITTVNEVLDYPWPDSSWMDVSQVRQEAQAWKGEFAILGGDWSPFWHDVIDFTGMERLYYMMYDYPEVVSLLFEKVTDFYYEVSESMFEASGDDIDIFFIGNDLGSQTGPLIGLDLFERFIKPSLKRLVDLGHRYGHKVMMHCCGGFRPLIPSMIEAGLDGIHALQPFAAGMEPASLKRDFGNKILLNGGIDSQIALIEGTPEIARRETLRTLDIMAPGGGYVAGASHDYILEETPLENVMAMFDAILEYRR